MARTAAQRLLQEALTNAHRYGDGAAVLVVTAPINGYVTLSVRNRVRGLAPEATTGSGLGLVGMEERVHLLGGTFQAGPEAGEFVVSAQLPATAPQAPQQAPV